MAGPERGAGPGNRVLEAGATGGTQHAFQPAVADDDFDLAPRGEVDDEQGIAARGPDSRTLDHEPHGRSGVGRSISRKASCPHADGTPQRTDLAPDPESLLGRDFTFDHGRLDAIAGATGGHDDQVSRVGSDQRVTVRPGVIHDPQSPQGGTVPQLDRVAGPRAANTQACSPPRPASRPHGRRRREPSARCRRRPRGQARPAVPRARTRPVPGGPSSRRPRSPGPPAAPATVETSTTRPSATQAGIAIRQARVARTARPACARAFRTCTSRPPSSAFPARRTGTGRCWPADSSGRGEARRR